MTAKPLSVLILLVVISFSCGKKEPVVSTFNGFAQGTTYSVAFLNSGRFDPASVRSGVEKILNDFDMSLSLYQDSSVLSRINRNEKVLPDSFFIEAFIKSKEISLLTDGAFDITVGPLVKAWGFGPDSHKNFSEQKKDSLMQHIGMNKVDIRDGMLIKTDPGVNLDFNAIAQGYSVDVIYRYLKGLGISNFLVEIGGEVRVKGDKNGTMWRIGIDRPIDNNMVPGNDLQAVIALKDRALATSGNYRKFYVENGIKYSHTIDPRTGYPARTQLLSATVLAGDCATADGVATACMVLGKDKAVEFLSRYSEFEGYLIYSDDKGDFKTWCSETLQKYLTE